MPDQIKTCANCHNPFVYSEYEQRLNEKNDCASSPAPSTNNFAPITSTPEPLYCPICASIKASEAKHPPKPKK